MRRISVATVFALPLLLAGCMGTNPDTDPGAVDPGVLDGHGDDPGDLPGDDDLQPVDARVIAELPVMGASARLDDEPMTCEGMVCDKAVTETGTYPLTATAPNRLFVTQQVEVTEACAPSGCAYDWYGEGMQCLAPNGFYVGEFMDYPDVTTRVADGQVHVSGIGAGGGVCTDNVVTNSQGTFRATISEDLSTITLDRFRDGVLDYTEVLTKME